MTQPQIPKYTSHKTVSALEIDHCVKVAHGDRLVVFKDTRFKPAVCRPEMFARFVPTEGDFYVVYADGFVSFSPRAAFLEGYSASE